MVRSLAERPRPLKTTTALKATTASMLLIWRLKLLRYVWLAYFNYLNSIHIYIYNICINSYSVFVSSAVRVSLHSLARAGCLLWAAAVAVCYTAEKLLLLKCALTYSNIVTKEHALMQSLFVLCNAGVSLYCSCYRSMMCWVAQQGVVASWCTAVTSKHSL